MKAPKISAQKLEEAVLQNNDQSATPDVGYLFDYVSGARVKATPEEIDAVQVFSRRLVEDFGYPKDVITTRPQFRVRQRPSDESKTKGYPVDIAIFNNSKKLEDQVFMVVECKRPSRKDGEKQLKIYLSLCSASIGVWFNGEEHVYLHKNLQKDGSIEWVNLPTLPRFGQSIADIGTLTREQLILPSNLKAVFKDIRNHLAGNTTGITRDQDLAQEIMALLFCKIFDELDKAPTDSVEFRASVEDKPTVVKKRVAKLFDRVKEEYKDVFRASDSISLDAESTKYVVGELQNYVVSEAERDVIGEAFEVFIGPAVRGEEGQFFTPRNVVQAIVKVMDPKPGEMVIDPACGSGGFLTVALEHVWTKLENEAKTKRWSAEVLSRKKRETAMRCFRGLDKDAFLTRVTKAYMAIIGDGRGGIFCEDSLDEPRNWRSDARDGVPEEGFDCILTNPPFGSKIKSRERTNSRNMSWDINGRRQRRARMIGCGQPPCTVISHRRSCSSKDAVSYLSPAAGWRLCSLKASLECPSTGMLSNGFMRSSKFAHLSRCPKRCFSPRLTPKHVWLS